MGETLQTFQRSDYLEDASGEGLRFMSGVQSALECDVPVDWEHEIPVEREMDQSSVWIGNKHVFF